MKKIYFSLFCFSIFSCQAPISKIIHEDRDQYSILKQKEYIIINSPYSILREGPNIHSPIKEIIRNGTLLKVIYNKQVNNPHGITQWVYIENITDPDIKSGWLNPQEGILVNDIHHGKYWQKKLKE